MPRAPGPPVRANTMQAPAEPANVIDDFSPLITHESPSRMARQVRLAASEPTPGAVRPKAMTTSPLATAGNHCFFRTSFALVISRPEIADSWRKVADVEVAAGQLLGRYSQRQVRAGAAGLDHPVDQAKSGGFVTGSAAAAQQELECWSATDQLG